MRRSMGRVGCGKKPKRGCNFDGASGLCAGGTETDVECKLLFEVEELGTSHLDVRFELRKRTRRSHAFGSLAFHTAQSVCE